jgi:hypothetical protein
MFNDMIMPIFQWWQLIADSSADLLPLNAPSFG